MMVLEKAKLSIDRLRVCHDCIPHMEKITELILFGSAARDQMKASSDLDVAVKHEGLSFEERLDVQEFLEQLCLMAVDVVFCTEAEMSEESPYRVYSYIRKEGVKLWA